MSYHQSCRENKEWSFSEIGKSFRCVHDAGKCVHRHLLPKAIYESLIRIGLRVRRSALIRPRNLNLSSHLKKSQEPKDLCFLPLPPRENPLNKRQFTKASQRGESVPT